MLEKFSDVTVSDEDIVSCSRVDSDSPTAKFGKINIDSLTTIETDARKTQRCPVMRH